MMKKHKEAEAVVHSGIPEKKNHLYIKKEP